MPILGTSFPQFVDTCRLFGYSLLVQKSTQSLTTLLLPYHLPLHDCTLLAPSFLISSTLQELVHVAPSFSFPLLSSLSSSVPGLADVSFICPMSFSLFAVVFQPDGTGPILLSDPWRIMKRARGGSIYSVELNRVELRGD